MSITRDEVTVSQPRRQPRRQPAHREHVYLPTQRELSSGIIRLMEELAHGRREIDPASVIEAQDELYAYAEKTIMTANSALKAARLAVICLQWRRTKSGARRNVVEDFDQAMTVARRRDLDDKPRLEQAINEAEGEAKIVLEKELRELLLRDATRDRRPYRLGPKAMEYLTLAMIWWFRPVGGSRIEQVDLPRLVEEHTRFIDWLASNILFNEDEKEAYNAAKEADATEESDNDSDEAEEAVGEEAAEDTTEAAAAR